MTAHEHPGPRIADWQLARVQSDTAEGMRSAEDLALGHMPDVSVTAALWQLPGEFRMAVYLADIEGFGYGRSPGSCSARSAL